MEKIQKNIVLYIGIFCTIYTILPILAPLFAHFGLNSLANPIYWTWQFLCHQRPWRSYHFFDYQYADCARNTLLFGSLAISSFIIHFRNLPSLRPKKAIFFAVLMTLPLALDGTIQLIAEISKLSSVALPFYESTNLTRSITGALMGIGLAFAFLPLTRFDNDYSLKLKPLLKLSSSTFMLSFLLIPLFVVMWYSTSTKYTPSSAFIDHKRRFPGYNYEIASALSHSTITRTFGNIDDEDKYIARAKAYNKTEILEEYRNRNINSK
jgi:uncharacterized membrane protein